MRATASGVVAQEAPVGDSLLPSAIADMLPDRSFHTAPAELIGRSAMLTEVRT